MRRMLGIDAISPLRVLISASRVSPKTEIICARRWVAEMNSAWTGRDCVAQCRFHKARPVVLSYSRTTL